MASTSYRTRVIVKEHTDRESDFAGTYNLLVAAKSVPSPASPPNTVESTTMEDDQQTFEKGIKTSDSREITGNLEKEYLSKVDGYGDKKLDIIHLYGTDGIGGVAKYAYVGTATAKTIIMIHFIFKIYLVSKYFIITDFLNTNKIYNIL